MTLLTSLTDLHNKPSITLIRVYFNCVFNFFSFLHTLKIPYIHTYIQLIVMCIIVFSMLHLSDIKPIQTDSINLHFIHVDIYEQNIVVVFVFLLLLFFILFYCCVCLFLF